MRKLRFMSWVGILLLLSFTFGCYYQLPEKTSGASEGIIIFSDGGKECNSSE